MGLSFSKAFLMGSQTRETYFLRLSLGWEENLRFVELKSVVKSLCKKLRGSEKILGLIFSYHENSQNSGNLQM